MVINETVRVQSPPVTLILDTAAHIRYFQSQVGENMPWSDVEEIVIQIVFMLLNNQDWTFVAIVNLPDFNRMTSKKLFSDPKSMAVVQSATFTLANAIKEQVVFLGAYQKEEFPYFFHKFVGKDVLLSRLPDFPPPCSS